MAHRRTINGSDAEAPEVPHRDADPGGVVQGFVRELGVTFPVAVVDRGQAAYKSKFDRLAARVFSGGLQKVDPSSLASAPRDGVWLSNPGVEAEVTGLQEADIVVALDGWRVHNETEYEALRRFDSRPEMVLHVWRKGRSVQVPVRMMGRVLPFFAIAVRIPSTPVRNWRPTSGCSAAALRA